MPDSGLLFLSLTSLLVGVLLFLYPRAVLKLNGVLNKMLSVDEKLLRKRYVVGTLAFIASYAFFKLALMAPALRG